MTVIDLGHLHRFFRQISESASHACMLGGSTEATELNQWVIIGLHARQEMVLQGQSMVLNGLPSERSPEEEERSLFRLLEEMRQQAMTWPEEKMRYQLPIAGGLIGAFGYEFYHRCDSGWQQRDSSADATDWPELVLCEFEDWLLIDLHTGALVILTRHPQRKTEYQALWQTLMSQPDAAVPIQESAPMLDADLHHYLETFDVSLDQPAFEAAVERLKTDIQNGEIYQANLSIRLQKQLVLDPYDLFMRLCRKNPSPFSAFFKWPGGLIISNSPERLVQLNEAGQAQTRPIAGTRGRGKTPEDDARIGESLLNNEKERAEHLMLVDLARNDLGRVCQAGSVQVDDLLVLERYSHVTHLVSNVTGQLRHDMNGWDLIRALFPGGTITGCPKIRCVDILHSVEPVSRGFYTGSLGCLDATSQALDLNILIRSVFLRPVSDHADGQPVVYNTAVHVGAGIVHDAVGAHEYRECLRKATAILQELHSLEHQQRSRPVPEPL